MSQHSVHRTLRRVELSNRRSLRPNAKKSHRLKLHQWVQEVKNMALLFKEEFGVVRWDSFSLQPLWNRWILFDRFGKFLLSNNTCHPYWMHLIHSIGTSRWGTPLYINIVLRQKYHHLTGKSVTLRRCCGIYNSENTETFPVSPWPQNRQITNSLRISSICLTRIVRFTNRYPRHECKALSI